MKPRVWILRATNGYARYTKYFTGPFAVGDAIHAVEHHNRTTREWWKWTFTLTSGKMFL